MGKREQLIKAARLLKAAAPMTFGGFATDMSDLGQGAINAGVGGLGYLASGVGQIGARAMDGTGLTGKLFGHKNWNGTMTDAANSFSKSTADRARGGATQLLSGFSNIVDNGLTSRQNAPRTSPEQMADYFSGDMVQVRTPDQLNAANTEYLRSLPDTQKNRMFGMTPQQQAGTTNYAHVAGQTAADGVAMGKLLRVAGKPLQLANRYLTGAAQVPNAGAAVQTAASAAQRATGVGNASQNILAVGAATPGNPIVDSIDRGINSALNSPSLADVPGDMIENTYAYQEGADFPQLREQGGGGPQAAGSQQPQPQPQPAGPGPQQGFLSSDQMTGQPPTMDQNMRPVSEPGPNPMTGKGPGPGPRVAPMSEVLGDVLPPEQSAQLEKKIEAQQQAGEEPNMDEVGQVFKSRLAHKLWAERDGNVTQDELAQEYGATVARVANGQYTQEDMISAIENTGGNVEDPDFLSQFLDYFQGLDGWQQLSLIIGVPLAIGGLASAAFGDGGMGAALLGLGGAAAAGVGATNPMGWDFGSGQQTTGATQPNAGSAGQDDGPGWWERNITQPWEMAQEAAKLPPGHLRDRAVQDMNNGPYSFLQYIPGTPAYDLANPN